MAVEAPLEMFTLYPGERLDLSCSASDSTPAVNWTKDHVLVVDGEHTRIRNGHLEIESVELSDSGLYACTTFGNHSGLFNISGRPGSVVGGWGGGGEGHTAHYGLSPVSPVDILASSEDDEEDEESSSEEAKLLGSQKELRK